MGVSRSGIRIFEKTALGQVSEVSSSYSIIDGDGDGDGDGGGGSQKPSARRHLSTHSPVWTRDRGIEDSPLCHEINRVIRITLRQHWRRSINNSLQLRKHIRKRLGRVRVTSLGELNDT